MNNRENIFLLQRNLAICILFVAGLQMRAYCQLSSDTSFIALMNKGYELIISNPVEATTYFERAVAKSPGHVGARRQLGYLYTDQKKYDAALDQFFASERIQPSDTIKLQIGYILELMKRSEEAYNAFSSLELSGDPSIRDKASQAIAANPYYLKSHRSRWWSRVYAAPYYDSRWESVFGSVTLRRGYYLSDDDLLSAFGIAAFSGDTKSQGGTAPVIFSDNTALLGIGLRLKPFSGFQLDVQQGVAIDLIDRRDRAKTRGDFRAIAIYSNGIYAPYSYHDDVQVPFKGFIDLYSSFGYYSRYTNGIGYLQLRGGVRTIEVSRTTLDVYGRFDLVRDTEKEFYNNLIEGGFGARLTPHVNWGFYIDAEWHRGAYWKVADTPLPYDQYYNSFRLFLIFERMF